MVPEWALVTPAYGVFFASVLAVYYLCAHLHHDVRWQRSVFKTVPVTVLAIVAVAAGGAHSLALALLFGALGDFALSRPGRRFFLIGLIFFLICHLFYIALMMPHLHMPGFVLLLLCLAVLSLAILIARWLIPYLGGLKYAVYGYIFVITIMVISAVCLPDTFRLATYGAIAFMISDAVLSYETFVLSPHAKERRWTAPLIWISYSMAQVLLVLAFIP